MVKGTVCKTVIRGFDSLHPLVLSVKGKIMTQIDETIVDVDWLKATWDEETYQRQLDILRYICYTQ